LGSLIAERQTQKGMHGCVTVASTVCFKDDDKLKNLAGYESRLLSKEE
jgi:hypothetical protein